MTTLELALEMNEIQNFLKELARKQYSDARKAQYKALKFDFLELNAKYDPKLYDVTYRRCRGCRRVAPHVYRAKKCNLCRLELHDLGFFKRE